MSSGLTLGQARAQLPTAALSAVNAATAALAAAQINPAIAWVISSGLWRGTVQHAAFEIQDDKYITLPRGMLTVQAAVMQGTGDDFRSWASYPVANEWFQWVPGGPGFNSNPPCSTPVFESIGDGFVFFMELPTTGQLKFTNTTTESAGTVNIRGFDSSGDKVFTGTGAARVEGENIAMPTTASTSTTTNTTWNEGNSVYGIVKPTTNGILNVYCVNGATETLIASYEPGETTPNYRRYLVPKSCIEDAQVVVRAKIAQVPVVVDNDQIFPGSLTALELALMAVQFRRKSEMKRAMEYLQMSVEQLNAEVFDFNSINSLPVMQIDPAMALGPCANLV